jgi:DNA polymerase-3 subunit epsilon
LRTTCGVSTLSQLTDWLAATRPAGCSKRAFPMDPDIRRQLPDAPGIYRMVRGGGDLLYIGKAKSLRQRVNSYFRSKAPHAEHTLEMLTQARGLDVTPTNSALEAAILESDEIKRHSPPYNIALRRRNRQLAFITKDLARHAAQAHKDYRVGPLPAGKTIAALAAFGSWLRHGQQVAADHDHCRGCALLALPPEYAPEIDCLQAGWEIFRQNHQGRLKNQAPLRFLTAVGRQLWQEKLAAAARADRDAAASNHLDDLDEQPDASDDAHAWTPEAVAGAIEAMIRHSAHLIRRARWFCLLSESSLAWASAGANGRQKSTLVFAKGAAIEQAEIDSTVAVIPPPGYARRFRARQKNMDLTTYDRMRVVTTEIRRIVSEGRSIELRLAPTVTLGRRELVKALRWV